MSTKPLKRQVCGRGRIPRTSQAKSLRSDPNVATDQIVDFELNVDKSFRWVDQQQPGYTTGTYDTTPTQFEPVMAFGANTFKLTVSSAK